MRFGGKGNESNFLELQRLGPRASSRGNGRRLKKNDNGFYTFTLFIYVNNDKQNFLQVVSELMKEIRVCQIWSKNSKDYYLVQKY